MKETTRFNLYIDDDVAQLMKDYCAKTNKNYSKFVSETIKLFFQKNLKDAANKVMLPQEEKLNEILNYVMNIQTTVNACYRASDFSAYLNQQGKDEGLKDSARKKVQKDFNALMNGSLKMEEYLKSKPVTEYVYETVKPKEDKQEEGLFVLEDEKPVKHKIQPYEVYIFNNGGIKYDANKHELPDGYHLDETGQIVKD